MLHLPRCLPPTVTIWARSLLAVVILGSLAYCASTPATPAALAVQNSRYIFLPPIDDEGKSSGPHAVTICLPAGYDATDRRYPVIYILDGDAAFLTKPHGMRDAVGYEMVHDELVHEGLIEPAIFVAIHNSTDAAGNYILRNRFTDYCMNGQTDKDGKVAVTKSEGYYQYLAHKIKPLIDARYRTRPDPASTGVTGFSAGGAGTFWMTYMHPETFGMGMCQSPPFRTPYVGKEFNSLLADPQRPLPPVRLWIDAGSGEFDFIYKDAYIAYQKLVARGFRQNENIAFYTGHNHGHEKFDCNRRMRSALYFMLRTKTPKLTGVEITEIAAENGGPISLTRLGHVNRELVYDNWFRITDGTATFAIADPAVVAFDPAINEIRPLAAGHTTVTSSYEGRQLVQQIDVPAPEAARPCPALTRPVVIDGDLSEWPELPYKVEAPLKIEHAPAWTGPAYLSYRFGVTHDDQFLYIAIQTTDDFLNSDPAKDPWVQDGVEVRLDARPATERMAGKEAKEGKEFLLVALSPARPGETRLPYKADKLPAGTKAVCQATPTGHNTQIAIPVAYLNEKAGGPWSNVRVNIVVNHLGKGPKDTPVDKLWWRPDWRSPENLWESGVFERQDAPR